MRRSVGRSDGRTYRCCLYSYFTVTRTYTRQQSISRTSSRTSVGRPVGRLFHLSRAQFDNDNDNKNNGDRRDCHVGERIRVKIPLPLIQLKLSVGTFPLIKSPVTSKMFLLDSSHNFPYPTLIGRVSYPIKLPSVVITLNIIPLSFVHQQSIATTLSGTNTAALLMPLIVIYLTNNF